MINLTDEIPELIYVCDIETYELYYMNRAGRESFNVEDPRGRKCYEVFQGRTEPCSFCNNSILKKDEDYVWRHYNEITGHHYYLKDRLIDWEGRSARMEIAFDQTESEEEKHILKNALDSQEVITDCVRTLYREPDLSISVPDILKKLGKFLEGERTYVFRIKGNHMCNNYEWCSHGVTPQINMLQNLEITVIDNWLPYFSEHKCVIIDDLEASRDLWNGCYDILKEQDINSLVAAPLEKDGELVGYIGVDNPPCKKISNIAPLLQTLGYFLMLAMLRDQDKNEMMRLSFNDVLTGIYNRNKYIHDVEHMAGWTKSLGVVYLDVNGLKDINDKYGHGRGDNLLIECTRIMRSVFDSEQHYRIGGDEFVILCPGIEEDLFYQKVRKLQIRFRQEPLCHPAAGYIWKAQCSDLQEQISEADKNMYVDKKEYYHNNGHSNRYRHENDCCLSLADPDVLQKEIDEERFVVYLQPKVSLKDGTAIGAEALIRYRSEDNGIVLPGEFIPILEDADSISRIDFYVLDTVCRQLARRQQNGEKAIPISVNFSRWTLVEPGFVDHLDEICDKYLISRELLEVEITENLKNIAEDELKEIIESIRSRGYIVSIDDFGTHSANLSLLSSVEFDVLKVDKSLVDRILNNEKAETIVRGLVDMCRRLDISMVAEGVETQEQKERLTEVGIECAQGYLFSRPMPLHECEEKFLNE